MEIQALVTMLRKKGYIILLCAALAGIIAFIVGLRKVGYEATGTVLIRPLGEQTEASLTTPVVGIVYSPQAGILHNQSQSYLGLIKSRAVLARVVARLDMVKPAQPPSRRAKIVNTIKAPIRFLIYGRLPSGNPEPLDIAINDVAEQVNPSMIPASNIFRITAHGRDANRACDLANAVIEEFAAFGRERSIRAATNALAFVTGQLAAVRLSRDAKEKELDDIKREAGLPTSHDLKQEMNRLHGKILGIEDSILAHDERQPVLEKSIAEVDETLRAIPEYERLSYAMARNPAIDRLKQELLTLEIEIQRLLVDYVPTSVNVSNRTSTATILKQSLAAEIEQLLQNEQFEITPRRMAILQEQVALDREKRLAPFVRQQMTERLTDYSEALAKLEKLEIRFLETQRVLDVLQQRENDLILAAEQATAVAGHAPSEIEILDLAQVPRYPSYKGRPLIAYVILSAIGAAMFALAIVVYRS